MRGIIKLDDGLLVEAENLATGAGADFRATLGRDVARGLLDVHDLGEAGNIKDVLHGLVDIDDLEQFVPGPLFGGQYDAEAGR